MVYYRKYRPQTIAELDSVKVRETLQAIFKSIGNIEKKEIDIPHAFLFTGPKGLGKTSTARIIAKVVNCLHPKNGEPCNQCEQCVSITSGTNIDILEIDGASNRGIDEIRDLREKVKLAPSFAKKKVYIIDEVHMLTTEAFNALLKTIEEPPLHVMFIFCTTEPQKVPATILSRCFHIAFTSATEEEIVGSLGRIVAGEKLDADKKALQTIAQMAEGGFRDAAKILEEIVLMAAGKKITEDVVEEKFQTKGIKKYSEDMFLLLAKIYSESKKEESIKSALSLISDIVKQGTDPKFFSGQLLGLLNEKLLAVVGVIEEKEKTQFNLVQIEVLTEILSQAYQDAKFAVIPQMPLEIAVIKWYEYSTMFSQGRDAVSPQTSSGKPTMDVLAKKEQSLKVKDVLYPQSKKAGSVSPTATHKQNDIATAPDEKTALLENIIYKVKPFNHSVAGVLRGCKVKEITDTQIIFETAYKFHKERLEEQKTCEIIEKAVREITGKQLKVAVTLLK